MVVSYVMSPAVQNDDFLTGRGAKRPRSNTLRKLTSGQVVDMGRINRFRLAILFCLLAVATFLLLIWFLWNRTTNNATYKIQNALLSEAQERAFDDVKRFMEQSPMVLADLNDRYL